MEQLQQAIAKLIANYPGRYGMVVREAGGPRRWELNPGLAFPSASMIKVPVMYEVMRQAATGRLDLNMPLTVTQDVRVGGAGILTELRPDIAMSVRELVRLMIVLSDNTATNMLIDLLGMEAINHTIAGLGLTSTVLRRRMMDFEAAKAGRENETSAADMARMFEVVYHGQGLPAPYGQEMLDILKRQQVRDKLPFYLPEDMVIANKTGTLPGIEHDGGILYLPQGAWIVCILTGDLPANYLGIEVVAKLGRVIYEYLEQLP